MHCKSRNDSSFILRFSKCITILSQDDSKLSFEEQMNRFCIDLSSQPSCLRSRLVFPWLVKEPLLSLTCHLQVIRNFELVGRVNLDQLELMKDKTKDVSSSEEEEERGEDETVEEADEEEEEEELIEEEEEKRLESRQEEVTGNGLHVCPIMSFCASDAKLNTLVIIQKIK